MRLPSALNWTLLCGNMLLSAAILWIAVGLRARPHGSDEAHVLATDLPINGMELAFQKGPLVFSVGRDFPRSGSFAIAERGTPLMIRVDKSGDATGSPGESVNVALRSQFSVALDLTPTGAARQFTFSHAASGVRETLFDLNADGIFDVRHTEDIECQHAGRVFVRYRGSWQEVSRAAKQDLYHKRLMSGESVFFSSERGEWLLGTGEPSEAKRGRRENAAAEQARDREPAAPDPAEKEKELRRQRT